MDISKIDIDYIEFFSLNYEHAKSISDLEPVDETAKMQKKIRKLVEKIYLADQELPKNVQKYIDKDVSDSDFILFLKECYDYIQHNGTQKKQLFDKFSSDLSAEVKTALWELIDGFYYCDNIRINGNCAEFDIEFGEGYDRVLTLINVSGLPEKGYDQIYFENGTLVKVDGVYKLSGEAEYYEDETLRPIEICFTDAKVDITLYNATSQTFVSDPWCHLQIVAGNIVDKHNLSEEYLNDKEKEIFPLCAEIRTLSYWALMQRGTKLHFPKLKSYISKLAFDELLPLVEKMENCLDDKKRDKVKKKLVNTLNMKKYEPLWREIYKLIADSQKEYPERASAFCSAEQLNEERAKIQALMEAHGYSGKYPDFVKHGSIRNFTLAQSYDISYFVTGGKNAVHHIHCYEEYDCEHLRIEFLCGVELLRKNEEAGDIYSCLFNSKGRSFYQSVEYECGYTDEDGEIKSDNLESRVQIAVKRTELKKLTKEERREVEIENIPNWQLFLPLFIIAGGFFAVFMTLAFMLMSVVFSLIDGQTNEILSMFTDVPWWALFLFAWVSFGGAMGIITLFANRK